MDLLDVAVETVVVETGLVCMVGLEVVVVEVVLTEDFAGDWVACSAGNNCPMT